MTLDRHFAFRQIFKLNKFLSSLRPVNKKVCVLWHKGMFFWRCDDKNNVWKYVTLIRVNFVISYAMTHEWLTTAHDVGYLGNFSIHGSGWLRFCCVGAKIISRGLRTAKFSNLVNNKLISVQERQILGRGWGVDPPPTPRPKLDPPLIHGIDDDRW